METTQTLIWHVHGMHCSSCSILIDEAVEEIEGVSTSSTSLRKKRATVTFDPARCDPNQVAAAIAEAGYQATLAKDDDPVSPRRRWFSRTA